MNGFAKLGRGSLGRVAALARRCAWAVTLVVVAVTLTPRAAEAVPVFARRYGTSCQTCHTTFPRLTPFGEAFRRSGYRFPDGHDEDYRRQEPQSLGASAYRDTFPRSVWPGEIPGAVPLAVFMSSTAAWNAPDPARPSFASVGGTVRITAAATMGERFSAWAGVNFGATTGSETVSVSLERAFAVITPFDRPYLNVRIGRFEPGVLSFSSHRLPGPMPWILTTAVRDNQFGLEPSQIGFEAAGVAIAGRGTYAVGLVEGAGNQLTLPKDVYARVGFKLGGMRLDGVTTGDVDLSSPQPWREWSVLLGAFGYFGQASIGSAAVASQDDRFFITGGDVNAQLGDLSLIAAYSYGRNAQPSLANPGRAAVSHHLMAQADYVIFPWLVPGVRVEQNYLDGEGRTRLIGQVYALARANIRTSLTAIFEQPVGGHLDFTALQATLALGF